MKIDMHYHISFEAGNPLAQSFPIGCLISRREEDNERCFTYARSQRRAVALFADPLSAAWPEIVSLIDQKRALAYGHSEEFGADNMPLFEPVLSASEERNIPIVIHVSRHDQRSFANGEASKVLDYICSRYPKLCVIIAHCGGENFKTALRFAERSKQFVLDTSCFEQTATRAGFESSTFLLEAIAKRISSKQLLFGSDRTFFNGRSDPADLKPFSIVFSTSQQRDIFYNNAKLILDRLNLGF